MSVVSALRAGNPSGTELERESRGLRVAFAVGGLYTEGSGVARIVCDLANAMGRAETAVSVYAARCNGRETAEHLLDPPCRNVIEPGRWLGRLSWSPRLARQIESAMARTDIVHNHSLWMLPNRYAAKSARRHGKPLLYTVHGFLEPWALAQSRWKKRVVGRLFQDGDLHRADCLHVNSESELESVRKYGLRNPVAIIPNGVELNDFEGLPARDEFVDRFPELREKRVCLFLSRLHAKKGLAHLIQAWSRVEKEFGDWHLVIAGPDDGCEEALRTAIRELNLEGSVTVAGPLYGREKLAAYSAAEVFVLPSHSEGFSMAVLEAMGAGLPVLLTPGCNFGEAAKAGAAVEVEPEVQGTELGLRRLLGMSDEERSEMGTRARALIETGYTWDRVAERMLAVYRWLAGGGSRPREVVSP